MRKITLLLFVLLIIQFSAEAQLDTNLYNTTTAAQACAWLRNLKLSPIVSQISGMSNNLGICEIGPASRDTVKAKGMTDYYNNAILVQNDFTFAGRNMRDVFRNAKRAGIGLVRCPNMFPLGTIEHNNGAFNYLFSDSTVKIAGDYGINLVGTILPWADWADSCDTATPLCNLYATGADWFYINNNRNGHICPNDTLAYYTFVQNLVKRYGPGGNMPGLTNPIVYWEFCNEPDASSMGQCGSYDSATFLHDMALTYRALNSACSSCLLMNGGAVGIMQDKDTNFWYYVVTKGYNDMNIANFHDNDGRNAYPFSFSKYIENVNMFQHPLNRVSAKYPIWVTEWGIYCGTPIVFSGKLPLRTEDEQAAVYTKVYVWGLANNIGNEMFDIIGDTNSIGSAALINEGGMPVTDSARLFFYTQKLLQYKFRNYDSARVISFDTSTSFSEGEVHVYVNGNMYYILWGLSALPTGLSGTKIVTDIYGNADTENVANLTLPLGSDPIIVENLSSTAIAEIYDNAVQVKLYPNPFSSNATLQLTWNNAQSLKSNYLFTVYDLLGRAVYQAEIHNSTFTISRNNLPSGMYFYKLTGDNYLEAEGKFVIEQN